MGCDHNCIPCRGSIWHRYKRGWICVRCHQWFPTRPARADRGEG